MGAEYLRETAALMRERAEAATPGPWEGSPFGVDATESNSPKRGRVVVGWNTQTETPRMPDRSHIASWHPLVALAVAAWLDLVAKYADEGHVIGDMPEALAVARAYRGEPA